MMQEITTRARAHNGMKLAAGIVLGSCLCIGPAAAFDERLEDLSASVEVASVSELELSTSHLAFSEVSPGESAILGEGRYFNQIRCRSNSGRPWYLKARVVSFRQLPSQDPVPTSYLKWNAVHSTGHGEPSGGAGRFHEFSEQPAVIYIAQGDDLRGREVVLSFQYSLDTPKTARAGSYVGDIIFSMEEMP